MRVIPDVEKTIVDTLNLLRTTYDYVFTTGGIGPTHDDITAQAVSKAFGIKYKVHKEAFKILEEYYQPGEFNEGRQKMAWMPDNANLILNPTSGAPGFNIVPLGGMAPQGGSHPSQILLREPACLAGLAAHLLSHCCCFVSGLVFTLVLGSP